jgi:hypothetical protein
LLQNSPLCLCWYFSYNSSEKYQGWSLWMTLAGLLNNLSHCQVTFLQSQSYRVVLQHRKNDQSIDKFILSSSWAALKRLFSVSSNKTI